MLYALGVGCRSDPDDRAISSSSTSRDWWRCRPWRWCWPIPATGWRARSSTADYSKVLHGEQKLTLHRPLAASGTVIGRTRNLDLLDKGKDKGAVLFTEREIIDKASGERIATMRSTAMLRGDGGFGGKAGPQPTPHELPRSAPARHVDIKRPAQRRARLPPVGRPQSAARRPGRRRRAASPRRSCTACAPTALPGAPSSGPAAATIRRACAPAGALLLTGLSRRDDPHRDVAGRRAGLLPRPRPGARRGRAQQRPGAAGLNKARRAPEARRLSDLTSLRSTRPAGRSPRRPWRRCRRPACPSDSR